MESPSLVIRKNPSRNSSCPSVRNRLKLMLISRITITALSPRTINLNGTLDIRIARAKTPVATTYAATWSAKNRDMINTMVPNSLVLGSMRWSAESTG